MGELHEANEAGRVLGEQAASNIHNMVEGKVRQTIKDIGGTLPENLKPEEYIKELRKRIKSDEKKQLQPAEKPLKLTNPKGFEDTLSIIERHEPEAA